MRESAHLSKFTINYVPDFSEIWPRPHLHPLIWPRPEPDVGNYYCARKRCFSISNSTNATSA